MRRIIFGFASLIIIIAGLFIYLRPAFSINGRIVWRPEFEANLTAATKAQQKFQEKNPGLPTGSDLEVEAAQRILETSLIHVELYKEVDSKTLNSLLGDRIKSAFQSPNFVSAAEDLYGLNLAGIKKYIVTPQAEQDMLRSNLILQGKNLGDWLASAEKEAKIKIYFRNLKWNGSGFTK